MKRANASIDLSSFIATGKSLALRNCNFMLKVARQPENWVIAICLWSFILSLWQSRAHHDSHHWGYIYTVVADLLNGMPPYNELFVQYGIATPVLQIIGFWLFDGAMVGVGIFVGFLYAVTIFLSFRIWSLFLPKALALAATALYFSIHPFILYPWPNYISYTLLLASLHLLSLVSPGKKGLLMQFAAGVLMGGSMLARQSSAILYLAALVCLLGADCINTAVFRKSWKQTIAMPWLVFAGGLLLPLAAFYIYLVSLDAVARFAIHLQPLNQVYINAFAKEGPIYRNFLAFLWRSLFPFVGVGEAARQGSLYLLVIISNTLLIIWIALGVLKRKMDLKEYRVQVMCALFALSGLGASLHLVEVFRLQNGVMLGLGTMVYCLHWVVSNIEFVKKHLTSLVALIFVFYLGAFGPGVLAFWLVEPPPPPPPAWIEIPSQIRGQRWSTPLHDFYHNFEQDINALAALPKTKKCRLETVYNQSANIQYFAFTGPFKRIHFVQNNGHLGNSQTFKDLLKDLNQLLDPMLPTLLEQGYKNHSVIVIADFAHRSNVPSDYRLVSEYQVPRQYDNQQNYGSEYAIFIPHGCLKLLDREKK